MLITLKIIKALSTDNQSANKLCVMFNISLATLKRNISEARHLGAKIESYRDGAYSFYRLKNWDKCKQRTEAWIDLIEKETVLTQRSPTKKEN